ncbi:solute carrier organic anion transporter family member 4A1-like isoform X2 [Ornithodoros turicata]|uniref:solute carrier organic anion transporter family member 4A1-like isoform X2 n=1 Tax=Ornithodoros turicata TaxID=34597 RepID=UPI0031395737
MAQARDASGSQDDNDVEGPCGWGNIQPACLQRFRTPRWALVALCSASFIQGLTINGYVNVVLPTIEKRFQMRSVQSGSIISMYNVGSFIFSTPVAYYGSTRHKPRIIAIGTVVMGLGSAIFSVPHFLAPSYTAHFDIKDLCPNKLSPSLLCGTSSSNLPNYRFLFMFGNFLHGCGSSPYYTLGVAYLDDNVPTKTSPVYLGFISGGYFLSQYTDVTKPAKEIKINRFSKLWVGAWWCGFVIAACLSFIVSIPIFGFPKELPGYRALKALKKVEVDKNLQPKISSEKQEPFLTVIAFLLTNRVYVLLTLGGTVETMMASGLSAFITKILESQFGLTSTAAATLLGVIAIPSACGGTLLGGYIIDKFDLMCSNIIRMCVLTTMATWFVMMFILLHCPNAPFAGIPPHKDNYTTLKTQCNEKCDCNEMLYSPICGKDNVTYYSPCFAGCHKEHFVHGSVLFSECSCITTKDPKDHLSTDASVKVEAELTRCQTTCNLVIPFAIGLFLALFGTFFNSSPGLSATIRCVGESSKTVALGLQWVSVRLFGTIVAPIAFGFIIDRSCLKWQSLCGNQKGSCAEYENTSMSYHLYGFLMFLKTVSVVLFFSAWVSYGPAKSTSSTPTQGGVRENGAPAPSAVPPALPSSAAPAKTAAVGEPPVAPQAPTAEQAQLSPQGQARPRLLEPRAGASVAHSPRGPVQ